MTAISRSFRRLIARLRGFTHLMELADARPVLPEAHERLNTRRCCMAKILGWAVLIIFLIGLLVVLGFFKLIIPGG